jgi:type IV secretion system protein VirB10
MSDENNNNEFPPGEGAPEETLPQNSGKPAVAAAPGKTIFVLVGVLVFVGIVVKELFFTAPPPPPPKPKPIEHVAKPAPMPNASANFGLPTPPTELTPPPPPPPPPAVVIAPPVLPTPAPPVPELTANTPNNEELNRRLHANSLIKNSLPTSSTSRLSDRERAIAASSNDVNSQFANSVYASSAGITEATKVGNLNIMIVQGKIIQAVLESAINTDLPGQIRAIVSHDTYAEAGRDILIPKGSRIIGSYNSAVKRGQERVFIIWTRVIRPDGIDIAINSPGVDALGRAGMGGPEDGVYVDNKYFEAYEAAFLTSLLDIGVAAAGQGLFGNQDTSTTTGVNGTTTNTTGSAGSEAVTQAVQSIGNVSSNIVSSELNLSPTITVDQGSKINIFVNKDLVFSPNITGHSAFIE